MKKISWIVALLVALSFTILFSSCGEDPIPPKGITILVDDEPYVISPVVKGDAVVALADDSGFTWSRSSGYQGSYVYFKIEEPLNKKSKFTFKVSATGGDTTYKPATIYAVDDPKDFSPKDTDCATGLGADGSDWTSDNTGVGDATSGPIVKTFTKNKNIKSTTGTPYVCIYIHAPATAVYTISDIEIEP